MDTKVISCRKIMGRVFSLIFSRDIQKFYWPLWVAGLLSWIWGQGSRAVLPTFAKDKTLITFLSAIWIVLGLLVGTYLFLFELMIVSEVIDGKEVDWRESIKFAGKNLIRGIGMEIIFFVFMVGVGAIFSLLSMLMGGALSVVNAKLGVIVGSIPVLLGVAFIIYLSLRLGLSVYHIFLGNRPVIVGLIECWKIMKGRVWVLFKLLVLSFICVFLALGIAYLVGIFSGIIAGTISKIIGILVSGVIVVSVHPIATILAMGPFYLLYSEIMLAQTGDGEDGRENIGSTETVDSTGSGDA